MTALRRLALLACLSLACAVAPPPGFRASIQGEEAVIVWNPATHVEHFIRRAQMTSRAPDLGFLVPTPSKPDLSEASPALFRDLLTESQPRPQAVGWYSLLGGSLRSLGNSADGSGVTVLEVKDVAGYRAAILESTDPQALADWLKTNGYEARPGLAEWLQPYTGSGWKLTAFKVANPDGQRPATAPVRMSFSTERPFYPYREPPDQEPPDGRRELRVFFVSEARYQGQGWGARTLYSDRLAPPASLTAAVPPGALPPAPWLTTFYDEARVRGGVDVNFTATQDQSLVYQTDPQRARLWIPWDGSLALVVVVCALLLRRFQPRGASPSES